MIIIEKLYPDAIIPTRQTAMAIGYDAYAYINNRQIKTYNAFNEVSEMTLYSSPIRIMPDTRTLIPFGFRATLPEGIEAQIRSRSGLVLKSGITVANQPGTIDPDYTGEWGVILENTSAKEFYITHGDRVAQIVLNHVVFLSWFAGEITGQREGFGSTGYAQTANSTRS